MKPPQPSWLPATAVLIAAIVTGCGSAATPTPAPSPTPTPTVTASAEPATAPIPPTSSAAAGAADAYPLLAGFAGHFVGSWNDATFATTGSMTWDINADPAARTVTIVVAVGGNFFGGSGGTTETIELTHLAQGAISGHSAAFGDVAGTVTPAGTLTIALTNVPGGVVSSCAVTGTFSNAETISILYTVTFVAGGTATGTAALSRS